jgi:hypothetical protein
VLKQLKRDFVLTPNNKPLIYEIVFETKNTSYPSPDDQRKIIYKLEQLEILEIIKKHYINSRGSTLDGGNSAFELQGAKPKGFLLNIIENEFNKTFINYEQKYINKRDENKDFGIKKINLKNGTLIFNTNTGFVKLNKVENTLNPKSHEFRTLLILSTNKNYTATYDELITGNASKTSKRSLSFAIRNIKKILGILPIKKAKNKNIIKNFKMYGYGLIA